MKTAVIGHPVSHSKSPLIHLHWMNQYNIEGSYEVIDIHPRNLKDGIRQLIDQKYTGFNVTIPHKESMVEICDKIDETACAIGAINCVNIKDGKLHGTNTDSYGFIQNIKTTHPDFTFKDKKALILGAGGTARAVIYGLLQQGVQSITLTNRTKGKAAPLQKMSPNQINICDWVERSKPLKNCDLLINTTSLGMKGQPPLEINLDELPRASLVCDIVYAPLMTALLKQAQENGNPIVTGLGMLLHQAAPAFKSWTGIQPKVTPELERRILL
ncbi:MAG: shikimate dehydrogenase [Alphaproteobacteria bacterium]|nr:shikimate dehydrogenase [Alphaproteobacteria bacterium]